MSDLALPTVRRGGQTYINWFGRLVIPYVGPVEAQQRRKKASAGPRRVKRVNPRTLPEPVRTIVRVTAREFGLTMRELVGASHERRVVEPKQVAMFLARDIYGMSAVAIGEVFVRDRAVTTRAINTIAYRIKSCPDIGRRVQRLRERLARISP